MYSKEILVVLCILYSNMSVSHKVVRWLESPRITNWGTWGAPQLCRDNQYVSGINLKIEGRQGQRFLRKDDDTALNGIRLICTNLDGNNPDELRPNEGPYGEFRGVKHCPNGIATGFQLRSEPDQRGADDTAAVDMALKCTNFDGSATDLVGGGILSYGAWTAQQVCPPKTAVCGINTQVEGPQGNGDDSSLNNVNIACCEVPNPFKSCKKAELVWVTRLHCRKGLTCSTDFKTGFSTSKETSNTVSESSKFYQEIGFSVGIEGNAKLIKTQLQSNIKFGHERVNGKTASQIISETSTYEQTVRINVKCAGALQELHIRCRLFEIKTSEYRCHPDKKAKKSRG